jgi:transposase InsO family protein
VDGPVNTSGHGAHDLIVDVCLPSQRLALEVLQRPFESTQYLAIRYTDRLLDAGIEPSVGSRGDAYDNALAETINGLYKAEVIYHLGPWRGLEDVEYATLEWVAWYNSQRLMEPLGYVPPAEYEEQFHGAEAESPVPVLT